ncbi:NmrA family protein [Purpureocillium lavendulum]|uniref:NmrA family protein n=1 Tax=Purpureocillium lavendulum TaxID=1247861 RepID=A0AB34FNL3_9HYPO|nr:NmrA family protein [Purpureocillium lavendulum]
MLQSTRKTNNNTSRPPKRNLCISEKNMPASKLVTVYGATGVQGSAVVNSLLENKSGEFSVRAISRNPESDKAKALASRGVEVVKGDGFVKEQMLEAFKGSWAAFVNTNSTDPTLNQPGGLTERGLGKIIVDAAFEAGVQHFLYSGLASTTATTNGAITCRDFEEKYAVGEYAKTKGFKSVVIISMGWYMENHIIEENADMMGGFPFHPDAEGYLTLQMPGWGGDGNVPWINVEEDYGDIAHGVLLDPETYNGRLIQTMSQLAKPEALTDEFAKLTGKKARSVDVDWKSFDTYGSPDLESIKNMWGFLEHSGGKYYGEAYDLEPAKALKAKAAAAKGRPEGERGLSTLSQFVAKHFSNDFRGGHLIELQPRRPCQHRVVVDNRLEAKPRPCLVRGVRVRVDAVLERGPAQRHRRLHAIKSREPERPLNNHHDRDHDPRRQHDHAPQRVFSPCDAPDDPDVVPERHGRPVRDVERLAVDPAPALANARLRVLEQRLGEQHVARRRVGARHDLHQVAAVADLDEGPAAGAHVEHLDEALGLALAVGVAEARAGGAQARAVCRAGEGVADGLGAVVLVGGVARVPQRVRLGDALVRRAGVDVDAGRVDEGPDRGLVPREGEQRARAVDVGARVLAPAVARQRGEGRGGVEDDAGLQLFQDGAQRRRVGHVACEVHGVRVDVAVYGAVHDVDGGAGRVAQEVADEVPAEEAAPADDENGAERRRRRRHGHGDVGAVVLCGMADAICSMQLAAS